MHVIIIFILLILLCYLIMHWQISLPVLLFLIYLAVTFLGDTEKKHHFRFHALWWQIIIIFVLAWKTCVEYGCEHRRRIYH